MTRRKHDLDHEVYLDPKDHKEHVNHGILEYTEEDLKTSYSYYDEYHKDDVVESNEGTINHSSYTLHSNASG